MRHDTLVLVPAYNPDRDDLAETLRSVRAQTVPVDICLVDDGSTVPVESMIDPEPQLTVLRLDRNAGITAALRRGVDHALCQGYRYVARLDVGDRSSPDRIAVQRRYMEDHPEIDLLGSRVRVVDRDGRHLYDFGIVGHTDRLRSYLWKNSTFRHSTFFIRTDALRRIGNYDADFVLAQDYELLLRFAQRGKIGAVPDVLVDYLDDPKGLTMKRRRKQLQMRLKAQLLHRDLRAAKWYMGVGRTLVTAVVPIRIAKAITRRSATAPEAAN